MTQLTESQIVPDYVTNKDLRAWVIEMAELCKPDLFIGAMDRKKNITRCARRWWTAACSSS